MKKSCFDISKRIPTLLLSPFCLCEFRRSITMKYYFLSLPGPPSPPRDLVYTLKQSTLILEWAAPSDTGGRVDLTYSVRCRRCFLRQCEPCGASIGFVPQQAGLTERTVTVVNLLPNTNYTFTVEALNGVSELLPNKRFYTQVNVSTSLPGEFMLDHQTEPHKFTLHSTASEQKPYLGTIFSLRGEPAHLDSNAILFCI